MPRDGHALVVRQCELVEEVELRERLLHEVVIVGAEQQPIGPPCEKGLAELGIAHHRVGTAGRKVAVQVAVLLHQAVDRATRATGPRG
ncbi:MAG: hypothetical protein R3C10_12725 [Pirellulales bacterium]